MTKINVSGVPEARAASLALRAADKDLRKRISTQVRTQGNAIWKPAVENRLISTVDRAVLGKGTRVNSGARPTLVAGSSSKSLSGGLVPQKEWQSFEFGSNATTRTRYYRKNPGGSGRHVVTRNAQKQLPRQYAKGRALYKAAGEVGPRFFSLWAQTAVRTMAEALEGR